MLTRRRRKLLYWLAPPLMIYLLAVVISATVDGCSAEPHRLNSVAASLRPRQQLRVMTYNVNYDTPPAQTADVIQNADPDIVFLQESTRDWEAYASAHLNEQFPYRRFHHEPYAGGMGILAKHPIVEAFYEKPPAGWMHGWAITAETPLGQVQFLAVHLRPAASGQGGLTYLNYFRLGTVHPQEIEFLYTKLTKPIGDAPAPAALPMIVIGDFNEGDDGAAIAYLKQKNLSDSLAAFDQNTNTWHGKVAGISLSERCDHILHSVELKCIDAAALKQGGSDHYPVFAVFEKRIALP